MRNKTVDGLQKTVAIVMFSAAFNLQASAELEADVALLEFLAEWGSDDGEWIDPAQLEHLPQLNPHEDEENTRQQKEQETSSEETE